MEHFDIFDPENRPLNQIKERTKVHEEGDWHRTSQIWVINYKKEILCNLRSSSKDLFPSYWDLSIGGHVIAGENYEATAERELEEELGINVSKKDLKFLGDEKVEGHDLDRKLIDREHARLFLYATTKVIGEFKIQKEEIERISFIPIRLLKEIIKGEAKEDFKIIPIKNHIPRILEKIEKMELSFKADN